jgi:hypothetical protein
MHLIGKLGITSVFRAISSVMLPNARTALMSVHVTLFPFGDLKTKPNDKQFDTMEEMQRRVEEPLGQVTSNTTQQVYEQWIEKLNLAITTNGDYV